MQLLAVGLNHHTAPLKIRERAAVPADQLDEAVREITDNGPASEVTILSTCNRTEIYCRQEDQDANNLIGWLAEFRQIKASELQPYIYQHPNQAAVEHAFRVASGLDSMVLGEPQILGQMKQAYTLAHKLGATGKVLNRLFHQSFSVAKRVRTDTAIGASAVSVAYSAVALAKKLFSDLSQQTILLIGAGDTIELSARHLYEQGVRNIIVANRTLERAQKLADQFDGDAISLDQLPNRLSEADIIISSTASTLPILGKGAVETALKKRKRKPMFLVDLAVPRDIEAQVAELRNIYLYTVDDLNNVIEQNLESRRQAAEEAEKIVALQTSQFMGWLKNLDAVPTIRELRQQADEIASQEVQRARRRLHAGDDAEDVMAQLARSITQKLTHTPSDTLSKADDDQLLEAARRLFGLTKR